MGNHRDFGQTRVKLDVGCWMVNWLAELEYAYILRHEQLGEMLKHRKYSAKLSLPSA
jgi:hypothetical protein